MATTTLSRGLNEKGQTLLGAIPITVVTTDFYFILTRLGRAGILSQHHVIHTMMRTPPTLLIGA
jgi:hypothetical protein